MDELRALMREHERALTALKATRRALILAEYRADHPPPSTPPPTPTDPVEIRRMLRAAWKAHQARYPGASPQFLDAIRSAYQRGYRFALEPAEYLALVATPCDVCGGPVGNGIGLDRLDNRGHYERDNVRPCCGACNVERGRRPLGQPSTADHRQ